jgi:hypothetical protein
MSNRAFTSLVRRCINETAVEENLKRNPAIVLERVARGGGATNWFYCVDQRGLEVIQQRLLPGSCVSFYFDDRIQQADWSAQLEGSVERVIERAGECVIGALGPDLVSIEVDFITSLKEWQEFISEFGTPRKLFFGEFPGRDNDGTDAITMMLPDADGIFRQHPH